MCSGGEAGWRWLSDVEATNAAYHRLPPRRAQRSLQAAGGRCEEDDCGGGKGPECVQRKPLAVKKCCVPPVWTLDPGLFRLLGQASCCVRGYDGGQQTAAGQIGTVEALGVEVPPACARRAAAAAEKVNIHLLGQARDGGDVVGHEAAAPSSAPCTATRRRTQYGRLAAMAWLCPCAVRLQVADLDADGHWIVARLDSSRRSLRRAMIETRCTGAVAGPLRAAVTFLSLNRGLWSASRFSERRCHRYKRVMCCKTYQTSISTYYPYSDT
ncbi:hypothetical protein CC78DRAFT_579828 [Lojkania enalia]|uniref:Uncharacterized protein n=1 Tax=Lojkania enalia TaxID=147567 RepID=A0A9P4KAH7_9PLEO|nr:hypothetical protein CC78DRAFT_579828 [Didymosphaeria enalia]